jgi:hypothetical protein
MEIAQERNLTLTFSGDSLQNQVFDGFLCELQRRNYMVIHVATEKRRDCVGYTCIMAFSTYRAHSPLWQDDSFVTIKWFYNYQVPFKEANDTHLLLFSGDVYFFNYGLHYRPEVRQKYMANLRAYLETMKSFANWKLLLFRETTAQHFDIPGGDFLGWSKPKPWSTVICVSRFNRQRLAGFGSPSFVRLLWMPDLFRLSWIPQCNP